MRVHNHTSATTPLIYIIQLSRKKKKKRERKQGGCSDQGDSRGDASGADFESRAPSENQQRASNWKTDSQSLGRRVGGSPARPFGKWQNHSESVNGV